LGLPWGPGQGTIELAIEGDLTENRAPVRNSYITGMSTYTYPHTIENGAGERLTFIRRVQDSAGDRLEVENRVKPGSGPPMHVHHHQEEALTVEQGRIAYQRPGEPPQFAEPGETVVFKPGEVHRSGTLAKRTSSARATSNRPTTWGTS
jgi:quercetin dioxygenase-like cupin family protein